MTAIDGEGLSPQGIGGPHWYTLLNAYDSRTRTHRSIEQWDQGGLHSERVFEFLLRLPSARGAIASGFFLNYDITMWCKDLSESEKAALWQSGWALYRGPTSGDLYWIEYVPGKMFFVGRYDLAMGLRYSKFKWPRDKRSLMIYDVSGFSQRSFVATLREWQTVIGISDGELESLALMKEQRSTFTSETRDEQRQYNRDECYWLAEYVKALDATFTSEGVKLRSWHGPGAVAGHYMRKEKIHARIVDPASPLAMGACLGAYYGGRSELYAMGRFAAIHNYDIASAYPAAATRLPDLAGGHWEFSARYDPAREWAVYYCEFDYAGTAARVMPFPFRYKRQVFYPDSGEGWYHACEIRRALAYYPSGCLSVRYGWVYRPADDALPFGYIHELAARRLAYKARGDHRAIAGKLGLNSMYGKLAQHAAEIDRTPPFQSYYAAGYITSYTRARLLDFIWQEGRVGYSDADVVMLATDGVFCERERTALLGKALGDYEHAGMLHDVYLVQPGVWYTREGHARTRGFGKKTLDYERIKQAWDDAGPYAAISYNEQRFVGMGACAGHGDFVHYGTWQNVQRTLAFYPARKYVHNVGPVSQYELMPVSMRGKESEPYVPHTPADHAPALALYRHLAGLVERLEQPDYD